MSEDLVQDLRHIRDVDVIGDVHGCMEELIALLQEMGYSRDGHGTGLYKHPGGRVFAFVGDLVDKGPQSREVLEFVYAHANQNLCYVARGNHDDKLGRYLAGNPVRVGRNLRQTIKQLRKMSPSLKAEIAEWLVTLPYGLLFDDGQLLVCHAAPPVRGEKEDRQKEVMLYGYVSGAKVPGQYPDRLDWARAYDEEEDEDEERGGGTKPFVLYGHVPHPEPYLQKSSCCIDTACFGGGSLTAMQWPSQAIISTASTRPLDTGPALFRGYVKRLYNEKPVPITRKDLPYLMGRLTEKEQETVYLIDTDASIQKKAMANGLVLARLEGEEPSQEHHLYVAGSGVVYCNDTYRIVSLPLTKMYEYEEHPGPCREGGQTYRFVEKYDGLGLQVFEKDGQSYIATKSYIEGMPYVPADGSDAIVREVRHVIESKYPEILEPTVLRGKTLILEYVASPRYESITTYREMSARKPGLKLLAITEHRPFRYLRAPEVLDFAKTYALSMPKSYHSPNFREGLRRARADLDARRKGCRPEGLVVYTSGACGGEILFYHKILFSEFKRAYHLRHEITFKDILLMLGATPELREWAVFRRTYEPYLDGPSFQMYSDSFWQYKEWEARCQILRDEAEAFIMTHAPTRGEKESHYIKRIVTQASSEVRDKVLFRLIMVAARQGGLSLVDVQRRIPLVQGMALDETSEEEV